MSKNSSYLYRVVDVFTQQPLEGNPLAVFPQASGMDGVLMQRIARELNLSETVFVLPPTRSDCAARLRIFTPTREMVFAGHPTVGASFILRDEGFVGPNVERFLLEENVGPVPVRVEFCEHALFWLTTPPITFGDTFDHNMCAEVLGLPRADLLDAQPQLLSAGNPTIFIGLRSREAVDRTWLELAGLKKLTGSCTEPVCVFVFAPTPQGAYSRMFAPEYGIAEDPATGSSTGPLCAYMLRHQLVRSEAGTKFFSEQGTKMGRRSVLHVQMHGEGGAGGIDVGGHVTPLVKATMRI